MNLPHPKLVCVLKSWTSWLCQRWFFGVPQSADLDISLNGLVFILCGTVSNRTVSKTIWLVFIF
jgi:hypothetical protein